ncbi:hypothetical protein ACQY0O_000803 [Thecaphora frezii]
MNAAPPRNDPPDTHYLPTYTPTFRPPPPSGPPPTYAAALSRVYPYTLRPVLLFTTFVTFLYLLLIAISEFKDAAGDGVSAKLKIFYIVQGTLLMLAALLEVFGFVAAYRSDLKMASMYSRVTIPAYLVVVAVQILAIVSHYTLKKDEIEACVTQNTGRKFGDSGGYWWSNTSSNTYTLTEAEARSYCSDQWDDESTWAIVWLIVVVAFGIPFVLFSFAFVRQLLDPASVRVRVQPVWTWGRNSQQAPSSQYANSGPYDPQAQSYAMGAYPPNQYPPPPQGPYGRPPGQPPNGNDLPDYQRGAHVGEDEFDDHKNSLGGVSAGEDQGYGYSLGHHNTRPGSSRGVDARENEAAKDSQVTVKLDDVEDDKSKADVRTKTHDGDDGDGPKV